MTSLFQHCHADRLLVAASTFILAWSTMATAHAAPTPYQLPLLGASPVAPNVIFTLDDSGSMLSPLMPESLSSDKADGNCCNVQTMAVEEVVNAYVYSGSEKAYGLLPTRMPTRPSAEYLADARRRSSQTNTIYYDPEVRYEPWTNADGSLRTAPTAANTSNWTRVPTEGDSSYTTNFTPRTLGSNVKWCLTIGNCDSRASFSGGTAESNALTDYDPTVYYILDSATAPTQAGTVRVSIWNMRQYRTGSPSSTAISAFTRGDKRTDCTALANGSRSCSQAQELQNFATWYQYHRTRLMLAKASVSKAFSSPDVTGFRLGWGALNNLEGSASITVDGTSTQTLRQGVRNYTTSHRDAFYNWLFNKGANSGTPLRRATDDIGKYYSREDSRGPWADEPGTSNTQTVGSYASCRRAYHILTTDGYWGGDAAATSGAQADVESVDGPTITGPNSQSYQYKASAAANTRYKDGVSNMLADVAMYYWNRDLAPNMANKISPTTNNEAFWQHMVNYTVGLGVSGRLNNPGDLDELEATPPTKKWQPAGTTATNADDFSKADDLWHAAYNSRGQNLSAANSTEFASSLQTILTDIASESNRTAGVGLTGSVLGTGSAKYVPEYTSRDWTGDLKKFTLTSNGTASTVATWSAAAQLPAHGSRNIFVGTGSGSGASGPAPADAKAFTLGNLSSTMIAEMSTSPAVNANLIQFLRGNTDPTFLSDNSYRQRASGLGDIVNSTPLYVRGGLNFQYNLLTGTDAAKTYRTFLENMAKRTAVTYVGANDGMLHAFRDLDGQEIFAYIPRAVTSNLNKLADKNYGHRFFVDGPATETHAYINGGWKSVVLGTMGSGGKGLFAIDATSPENLASATAAPNQVLWEVNGANPNMGYLYGEVEAVPAKINGVIRWVALVGNGYYSDSNRAQLLVIDMSNGQVLKTIDTNVGTATAPNGLGTVRSVVNASGLVVAAYAGDAQGNVWRFDLSDASLGNWKLGFNGTPLFKATDSSNVAQPITAAPSIVAHPRGGNLVIVSTGKLIDEADRPGVSTNASQLQTIYGLWDKKYASQPTLDNTTVISSKSSLVQQIINTTPASTTADGRSFYNISTTLPNWSTHRGWYLNMTLGTGQRVVYPGQVYQGLVFIGSVVPTTSTSCGSAGAFNFLLDALTGNTNKTVLLDTNGDGVLDNKDSANAGAYSTANDGSDRIVVKQRQNDCSSPGSCQGNAGGDSGCASGAQIVSASGGSAQCIKGGAISGSRTWRILTNPPRAGDQLIN
jgi:type IV pilus assembly protein PilY1